MARYLCRYSPRDNHAFDKNPRMFAPPRSETNSDSKASGGTSMRKIILTATFLTAALSFVWALPARAQTLCCQMGTTYGPDANPLTLSCYDVSPRVRNNCKATGGTITSGPCDPDNHMCAGSMTCCAGVSIGETCYAAGPLGPDTVAGPDSCAPATERRCDRLSAAGERATVSVPGTDCVDNSCTQPTTAPSDR